MASTIISLLNLWGKEVRRRETGLLASWFFLPPPLPPMAPDRVTRSTMRGKNKKQKPCNVEEEEKGGGGDSWQKLESLQA